MQYMRRKEPVGCPARNQLPSSRISMCAGLRRVYVRRSCNGFCRLPVVELGEARRKTQRRRSRSLDKVLVVRHPETDNRCTAAT